MRSPLPEADAPRCLVLIDRGPGCAGTDVGRYLNIPNEHLGGGVLESTVRAPVTSLAAEQLIRTNLVCKAEQGSVSPESGRPYRCQHDDPNVFPDAELTPITLKVNQR